MIKHSLIAINTVMDSMQCESTSHKVTLTTSIGLDASVDSNPAIKLALYLVTSYKYTGQSNQYWSYQICVPMWSPIMLYFSISIFVRS